jgi:hypothetical protein
MPEKLETEEDYREALIRFLEICHIPSDSPLTGELYRLVCLLEKYEEENC